MLHRIDLKEVERQASLYYGDGLLDIAVGFTILLTSGLITFEYGTAMLPIYIILLVPILRFAKKTITVPRIPALHLANPLRQELKTRQLLALGVITLFLLLLIGVTVFFVPQVSIGINRIGGIWAVLTLLLAAVFAMIGWGKSEKRLGIYALLASLLWTVGFWLEMSFLTFLILGVLVLVSGLGQLRYFMHQYPLPPHK